MSQQRSHLRMESRHIPDQHSARKKISERLTTECVRSIHPSGERYQFTQGHYPLK